MVRTMFAENIKKRIVFILSILLVFSLPLPARAAQEAALVRFGGPLAEEENSYKIPLCITGNQGIMGYYITITMTSGDAHITGAWRGTLTEKGVFDFKVSDEQDAIEILWAGADEVSQDGELAYLIVSDSSGFRQECALTISYSQADTFDEAYRDVKLECYSGTIRREEAGETSEIINQINETKQNTQTNSDGNEQVYEEPSGSADRGVLPEKELVETQKETTDQIVSPGHTEETNSPEDLTKKAYERALAESGTIREEKADFKSGKAKPDSLTGSEYKTGDDEIDSKSINIEEKIRKGKTFREEPHESVAGIIILGFAGVLTLITIVKRWRK